MLLGWIENIEQHAKLLKETDYLVHLAAAWGGEDENYKCTLKLFNLLDPLRCQRIIYFSTASILDENNQALEAALRFGTPYIRSKYKIYKELKNLRTYERIRIIFPTAIIGGNENHPYSHVAESFRLLPKWIKLVRFFSFDGGFHFIHAEDLAKAAKYLLKHETAQNEYVMGNDYVTLDELIDKACERLQVPKRIKIPIPINFILFLIRLLKVKIDPWGYFSLSCRHFRYNVTRLNDFGIESRVGRMEKILEEYLPVC
jgi:nucleoside-diphosphate-sugar epimerase